MKRLRREFFRREILLLVGTAVAGLSTSSVTWAEDYPARSVTIVVPFTPAGSTDMLARMLGRKLEQRLGKTFVIENRPGAGTLIAASAAAKAPPDGHLLLPYDPTTDFIPLAGLARVPFVLLVHTSLPVQTLQDFIKYAAARPGQLSFASVGPGVPHHLYAEILMSMTGIKMSHVPYKGSAPALNDLAAGHIPLMFSDIPPALGVLQAGKVRALGVTTATRVPAIANVPSIAEAGLPEFNVAGWHMLVAPGKTPRAIVEKLHAQLVAILAQPEVKDEIIRLGMLSFDNPSVTGLQGFVTSEMALWGKILMRAGVAQLL
jgi:tripartite-type tricarboxylate transporter receptor subunit TctC